MPQQQGPNRKRMGDLHEEHIEEKWGGRRQRGSGNQWSNPCDVREDHTEVLLAIAADGKSTAAASISIQLADLRKLCEQAGAEIPVMPVRFYLDHRLQDAEDWVLLREEDALAWRSLARQMVELDADVASGDRVILGGKIHEALREAALARPAVTPQLPPDYVDITQLSWLDPEGSPGTPWRTIASMNGMPVQVRSVRIEQPQGSEPLIVLNDCWRVRNGRVTRDGVPYVTVGAQPA